MSTDDQRKGSEIHGEALKAARDEELLDRLPAPAEGREDLRSQDRRRAGRILMATPASAAAMTSSRPG